jgi:hypothetical protein
MRFVRNSHGSVIGCSFPPARYLLTVCARPYQHDLMKRLALIRMGITRGYMNGKLTDVLSRIDPIHCGAPY